VSLLRRVDGFLFGAESSRRLVVTHLALAVVVGLRVALGPYRGLADLPPALFRPVWFLAPLADAPPLAAIVALQVAGTLAAAAAFSPRHRRVAFAVAWACLLVLAGLRASRGKVLHNDVLLLLACVPFLAAPAVRGWGDRRPSASYGWPVRAALVVVAGAYFLCGLHKLRLSGLAWVTSDNLRWVMAVAARSGRPAVPEVTRFVGDHAALAHVAAAAVLALELSFPVVLVRPSWRPAWAAAAVAFHAATWVTLGIDYWAWAAVAVAVLVDWDRARLPGPATARPPTLKRRSMPAAHPS
jgi:hypothetical protein